jgi:hypothetical protein
MGLLLMFLMGCVKMATRIPWDIYEAALLLDTCIKVINNEISHKTAVSDLSKCLRYKAENQGMVIDSVFRNENGINLRLAEMEYLVSNKKQGLKREACKLYREIYEIYKSDRNEYEIILSKAKDMVKPEKNLEKDFYDWLSKKVPSSYFPDYELSYHDIEDFCLSRNILKDQLFCTTDLTILEKVKHTILKNSMFRFKYKNKTTKMSICINYYITYIKEYSDTQTETSSSPVEKIVASQQPNLKKEEVKSSSKTYFDLIEKLVAENDIDYIDKRSKNGCIWLIDSKKTRKFIKEYSSELNVVFRFQHIGSPSTQNKPAWWATKIIKDKSQNINAVINKTKVDLPTENNLSVEDSSNRNSMLININYKTAHTEVIYDFNAEENLAFTKPISFSYFDKIFKDMKSWTNLYVNVVKCLYDDYPRILNNHLNKSITGDNNRIDFGDLLNVSIMKSPKMISKNFYLETNLSASNIVSKIRQLLGICNVDYDNLEIKYCVKSEYANANSAKNSENIKKEINSEIKPKNTKMQIKIKQILENHFKYGFRIDSRIDFKRFNGYYLAQYGEENNLSQQELMESLYPICIESNGFLYLTDTLLSKENEKQIVAYINKTFSEGIKSIYYSSIMKRFEDVLIDEHISNESILSSYLKSILKNGFYFYDKYFSKTFATKNDYNDYVEDLEKFLLYENFPVSQETIFAKFHYLPEEKIIESIRKSSKIVNNSKKEYFNADIIDLSEDEIQRISYLIKSYIDNYEFMTAKELRKLIHRNMPDVLERYSFISELGFRSAIASKLGNLYYFKANIISAKNSRVDTRQVYSTFSRNHHKFTIYDLNDLKEQIGTNIYFQDIYENAMRISWDTFVAKSQANFNIEQTDKALSRFFSGNFLSLSDVMNFGTFPYCGFTWNVYLLEYYVWAYSKKFTLMHTRFGLNYSGAIIRSSVKYANYEECLTNIVADNLMLNTEQEALDYLVEKKYINSRKLKSINTVLQNAKAIRIKRG